MTTNGRCFARHEFLFHIVYGNNMEAMLILIHGMSVRLDSIIQSNIMTKLSHSIHNESCHWPVDKIRALFFLLLNVDMKTKHFICNTKDESRLEDCTCMGRLDVRIRALKEMCQSQQASAGKLRNFFVYLKNDIVQGWLQDDTLTFSDLAQRCREMYLLA